MKNAIVSVSLAVAVVALQGCGAVPKNTDNRESRGAEVSALLSPTLEVTTPAELPTLPEHLHMRFAQLRPEMPINEFKALFPEAYFVKRERVQWSDHPIDAYELAVRQRYSFANDPQVYVQSQKAWFYFMGSGLESWGEPESWPTPPPAK